MPISPDRNNKSFKHNFLMTNDDDDNGRETKTKVTFNLEKVQVLGAGEIDKEKS
jgi:hypothetical protein